MSERDARLQRMRCVKAVAIVLVVVLLVPLSDALVARSAQAAGSDGGGEPVGVHAEMVSSAPDAFAGLERLEADLQPEAADLPDDFLREVGLVSDARDVRVSGDAVVVGYLVDSDEQVALESLVRHMQDRKWTCVPLGEMAGATFVKEEGSYRWILATCTQVGNATSVVMRRA